MSFNDGQQISVLHVDDEPDFAELVGTYLQRHNEAIAVDTATSAYEGLDYLDSHSVDCIVSDHDMPRMDGLEFLREVRSTHPDLPFILFTGKGSEEIASDAISAGVTEYLQKKSGTDTYAVLANRIERAVEEYRAKSALEESERMLSTLTSNLPGMAYRCLNEPGWPMEFVSEGCRSLTGYEPAALEGESVSWGEDIIAAGDRSRIWDTVQDALAEREPFEVTYQIETADGETLWVWEQGRGVFSNGELLALEGIVLDISDKVVTGDGLEVTEISHGELDGSGPPALVVADLAQRTVLDVNERAESLFESSRETLLEQSVSALFPTDVVESIPELRRPAETISTLDRTTTRIETGAVERPVKLTTNVVETDSQSLLQLLLEPLLPGYEDAARFEPIIERIDDAFVALNTEREITYLNSSAASLVDADTEDLRGTDLCQVIPEGIGREFEQRFAEAMESGDPVRFESYSPALEKWFDVHLYPSSDGLSLCAREVTGRKDRAAELERYRTLVENVGDSMYVLDTEGMITMANQAMADYLGYDRDEIVGSHATRFMPEADVQTGTETIRELLHSEQTWGSFEMETIHADGSRSLNEDKVAALTNEDGAYVGSVGVIRDISERKQRERELRRYETIIQAVGDPVYALDTDGEFIFVNDAVADVVGYEPEELIGRHASSVMAEEGYQTSLSKLKDLINHDVSYLTYEVDLTTKEGRSVPTENHMAILLDGGQFQGTAGVIRDISERKRREKRLEEFASVVSHDLQSPLNVIAGRAELALETGDLEHVEDIQRAAERMDTLIADLLTLAQEGRMVGERTPTSLSAVVSTAWEQVQSSGATLVVDIDETVDADQDRLRELFSNLFRNAVQHGTTDDRANASDTAAHGDSDVTVTVGPLGDQRGFYVADDGRGIDPERRDRVFEHGHTTSDDGTGLGLSIVKNIAEAHGWTVRVTESESGGARFEILTG